MKIIGFILAFLFLLSSAFVGIVGGNKGRKLGGEISEMTAGLSAAEKAEVSSIDIPSSGRLTAGGIAGMLAGVGALVVLISAFAKKSAVPALCGAVLALGALAAAVLPHVETGPMDGAAPRPLAVVALVLALVGCAGAMLAAARRRV